ncbi:MAG TPA: Lrp/AsnC family transcriptional regulator [Aldersonia sp.]
MLDDIDCQLISALRVNSRAPVAVLARELRVNRSTVTARIERIERLRETGVIEAFTIRLSNDVGGAIRRITLVTTAPNQGQAVVRVIRRLPEVEFLHSTVGVWDLVVQLRTRSLADFDTALERIRAVPGVTDTQPSLLFNSLTDRSS